MGNITNKINGWTDRYRGILVVGGILIGILGPYLIKLLQYLFKRGIEMPSFVAPLIIMIELIILLLFYSLLIQKNRIIKNLKNAKNTLITIRPISDKISQPINGEKLIKKWDIESDDLYNMVKKRYIKAYNPGLNAVMNDPSDNIDLYLDTYTEFNETYLDVILRWMFKPEDIRDFENKIAKGKLNKYALRE